MDELFEIMTLKMLDKFPKPIGILSIDGYYDSLYLFLHFMIEK